MLNQAQLEIVNLPINTHIRILACAGSGKTTTLLHRIKHLIDNNVNPTGIILTTFTRDAADEMDKRLKQLDVHMVETGTLDSIAYKHCGCDKNTLYHINEYIYMFLDFLKSPHGYSYIRTKTHLIVDEFQDIDDLQWEFIKIMSDHGVWIIGVGDDYQNIYTFRNSQVKYILNMNAYLFSTVSRFLTKNYRSSDEIISIANTSIKKNKNQVDKLMIGQNILCGLPTVVRFSLWKKQFEFIVRTMRRHPNESIAILSRNNSMLLKIENHLCKWGVPNVLLESYHGRHIPQCDNHVTLATLHKSKGLEWGIVFILGLDDDHFPSDKTQIEEERRLFYVAVTRARKHLYMMYSSNKPSRFLRELDENQLVYINTSYSDIVSAIDGEQIQRDIIKTPISRLESHHYQDMRKKKLLPKVHSTQRIHNSIELPKILSDHMLDRLFHDFCLALIAKQINIHEHSPSHQLVVGVPLSAKEYKDYHDNHDDNNGTPDRAMNSSVIERINNSAKKYNCTPSQVPILRKNHIKECRGFAKLIRHYYTIYRDPNIHWKSIIEGIFYLSMSSSALDSRYKCFNVLKGCNLKVPSEIEEFSKHFTGIEFRDNHLLTKYMGVKTLVYVCMGDKSSLEASVGGFFDAPKGVKQIVFYFPLQGNMEIHRHNKISKMKKYISMIE
uniref:UvrD-like helicase C-terminal domain protein n=1 Tax=Megaviridae environmental sample TaxID=1737588 RepID=A0A5J6VHV5_9VIRU|nr:MAG: UvrD-like helicase C-terminal domain protein [Megaviridae environmental sample]